MAKSIIWSRFAINDIRDIYHYIRSDSLFYADRLLDEIVEKAETLISFPHRGRMTPELHDTSIREIFVKQYRLIYKIEENRIVIHGVIHMARDLEALFGKEEGRM